MKSKTDSQKVYIAVSGDSIKIGRSYDPKSRVKDLAVGNPEGVELGAVIDATETEVSTPELEKGLHRKCERWSENGEWFELKALYYIMGFADGVGYEMDGRDSVLEGFDVR